jgi:hypothetical protein
LIEEAGAVFIGRDVGQPPQASASLILFQPEVQVLVVVRRKFECTGNAFCRGLNR